MTLPGCCRRSLLLPFLPPLLLLLRHRAPAASSGSVPAGKPVLPARPAPPRPPPASDRDASWCGHGEPAAPAAPPPSQQVHQPALLSVLLPPRLSVVMVVLLYTTVDKEEEQRAAPLTPYTSVCVRVYICVCVQEDPPKSATCRTKGAICRHTPVQ